MCLVALRGVRVAGRLVVVLGLSWHTLETGAELGPALRPASQPASTSTYSLPPLHTNQSQHRTQHFQDQILYQQ